MKQTLWPTVYTLSRVYKPLIKKSHFSVFLNQRDYTPINLRESCIRRKPITSRSHSEITQDGNPVLQDALKTESPRLTRATQEPDLNLVESIPELRLDLDAGFRGT